MCLIDNHHFPNFWLNVSLRFFVILILCVKYILLFSRLNIGSRFFISKRIRCRFKIFFHSYSLNFGTCVIMVFCPCNICIRYLIFYHCLWFYKFVHYIIFCYEKKCHFIHVCHCQLLYIIIIVMF
jgi:hypothetical protein